MTDIETKMIADKSKNKLKKSGRKWREAKNMPYRKAIIFCEKCGKELGEVDVIYDSLETNMFCSECMKEYIRAVPYDIENEQDKMTVVADYGNTVDIHIKSRCTLKVCYFNKNGRYVKIKGKRIYLNKKEKCKSNA